jgi:DNA-binding helix-hairpin-helix protein with protein kinase domain
MTRPELFISGNRLEFAKRLGKGGEGEVFLLAGDKKKAVKIYTGAPNPDREVKVRSMVRQRLSQSSNLVAFPEEIVTTRSGQFAGFSMRLVEGFREVHELYGPKSRKIYYPKADFRFLVRTAANAARAVGQVHSSPCVIGDLNESGLLVSAEAIVALIDADSFQFEAEGRIYPCLVGKPDFTAPELHGKSLAAVTRTKAHDQFGLGVAIFQLLFMGRHPYAGLQKGSDLSLDEMIARNLFAYTKQRQNGVTPPGVLPSLNDFSPDIADGFERAFGLEPARRPSAAEWVNLLQGLERQLNRCANDSVHYYPSTAKACPWCRMEGATGAVLFLSPLIARAAAAVGVQNFDVEKAWLAIKAVVLPDPKTVTPKLPALKPEVSQEAKAAKGGSLKYKLIGLGIAAGAVTAWVNVPDGALLWVGALIFAFFQFGKTSVDQSTWRTRFSAVDARWDETVGAWRSALGVAAIVKLRDDLEAAVNEYRGLSAAKSQALSRLKNERHARQLNEYLDRFLIRRASIGGIGQAKTITLASFGIESAADIKRNAILGIPGFGPATVDKLVAWRAQHERRFVYDPAPNQSDKTAQAKLDSDFASKATSLAQKISGGQVELIQAASSLRPRLQLENPKLSGIASERAQLEADMLFLGIAKPLKPSAQRSPFRSVGLPTSPPSRTRSGTSSGSAVTCPNCGSRMVRRTAKRGYRRGSQFWGCSRYPACRGTRS